MSTVKTLTLTGAQAFAAVRALRMRGVVLADMAADANANEAARAYFLQQAQDGALALEALNGAKLLEQSTVAPVMRGAEFHETDLVEIQVALMDQIKRMKNMMALEAGDIGRDYWRPKIMQAEATLKKSYDIRAGLRK